jgi:hypothetical protein
MTVSPEDDLFTKKHHNLLTIASWANIFAWVVLVIFFLLTITDFFNTRNQFNAQVNPSGGNDEFFYTLRTDWIYVIYLVLSLLKTLFQGIIFWIVLKGTSMGLNMIVETDINYRLVRQEVSHE